MDDIIIFQGVEVGRRDGAAIAWHPDLPADVRQQLAALMQPAQPAGLAAPDSTPPIH